MWKITLILLILYFYYMYYKSLNIEYKERFENKMHSNTDFYDKQYVDFYQYIYDLENEHKRDFELFKKYNLFNDANKNEVKILDGGCGTGIISDTLQKKGYDLTCVDKSESYLKKAELKNIFNRYILGNLETSTLFEDKEFNIIISDYDSFYHNNYASMVNIIKNYYMWLKDDGYIIFYLLNNKYLDPSPREYSQYYFDNKGNKHSLTYFNGFSHNAWFLKDNLMKDKYLLYEKIMMEKDTKSRIKITPYHIPNKNIILKIINNNGFNVSKIMNFDDSSEYEILLLHKKK